MSPDQTSPHGLEEGVALALRAQDSGDWKPVVDWLGRYPEHAEPLARFVGGERELNRAVAPARPPARAGAVLGDFELVAALGSGTAGTVYQARNLRNGREVAVKVLNAWGALSPADLHRFRFEAEAMAGLDHPNVVPVFDYGEADGVPYIAMPLLAGTLAARLKELGPDRRLPVATAAVTVREVARGVHHAHQRGLIHRDLKPANILLDRDGRPHVADFGLARRADASASTAAGSPAYMAPEQARGERHLTTAVDVHALGAVLFELLTGHTPFGGGDVAAVLRRVTEEPPPPVRAARPEVPRDLELICLKCLSKSPEDRYPSAEALAADLDRFLNGEPPSGSGRAWMWNAVARSMGWRRETLTMGTWRAPFWGALSTLFAMAVIQAGVALDAPRLAQAGMAYYLIAWAGIVWAFLVLRRDALNPVERGSTSLQLGMALACGAVAVAEAWLHGGNLAPAIQPFAAIVGLGVFAHGSFYWGRLFLAGLAFIAFAAAMPLVPVAYWPGAYGLFNSSFQIWVGLHLRRVHKDAEAARQAGPDPPTD